jgi:uncharacterized membrane protein YcfT
MIELIIYGVLALVCFTIFGFSAGELGMWQVLALSLVWPITAYWFLMQLAFKVIPWKA